MTTLPDQPTTEALLARPLWEASLRLRELDAAGRALVPSTPHSKRAYGLCAPGSLAQPFRWVEPSLSMDDAISEARRIAAEVSTFRCGFAWSYLDRWYAADQRPGLADEVIAVDLSGARP